MKDKPLTAEQRQYADEHHNLVYRFLRNNHLKESEYYDIVVFGYLKAVKKYLSEPDLQPFAFTTIAWSRMSTELHNHYRSQKCQKRKADVISVDSELYQNGPLLSDILPSANHALQQFEDEMLIYELAKHFSGKQMDMVRQKADGYGIREIAESHETTMQKVRSLLEDVRNILLKLCSESV